MLKPLVALLCATAVQLAWASSFPDQTACDALDETLGVTVMDWTAPSVRSANYTVRSGDSGDCNSDPTSYTPGEYMEIHVRTLKHRRQFRGFMLYAVDKDENRVGDWDLRYPESELFWKPAGMCQGKSVMHVNGAVKHYHHVFHFLAPPKGTGTITFRALLKRGEANLGEFYWPNAKRDLSLTEGSTRKQYWYRGMAGQSCDEVCSANNERCDATWMKNAGQDGVALYKQFGRHTACNLPVVEQCGVPHVTTDNWCVVPGADCPAVSCSDAVTDFDPLCACGTLGGLPAEDLRDNCMSAAPGSRGSSVPMLLLLAFSTSFFANGRARLFLLAGLALIFVGLPSAEAHNWMISPSRSRHEASTIAPCIARFNESIPHFQVGPGQTFEIEWATGHNHWFYFAVLHADDYLELKNATAKFMDQYVEDALAAGRPNLAKEPKWQRQAINRDANAKATFSKFDLFEKQLTKEGDGDYFIERHERMGGEQENRFHWKYTKQYLDADQRVEYNHPDPDKKWLLAVHKFQMSAESRPSDLDTARIAMPAGAPAGKYIVHYLWRGYRDCIDVDLFPSPVDSTHGRKATEDDNVWMRLDHCQFEDFQDVRTPCTQVVTDASRCLKRCRDDQRCGGVNVVPRWNPTSVYPDFQKHVALPWASRNCDENKFANADENTLVCYGVRPKVPAGNTFSPYTVSLDPEDPIFYSTCYVKTADWLFDRILDVDALDPSSTPIVDANGTVIGTTGGGHKKVKVSPWAYGGKCVSCEDRDHHMNSLDVPFWKLSDTCELCDDEAAPYVPESREMSLLAEGRMCDGQVDSNGIPQWNYRDVKKGCERERCWKGLYLLGASEMTHEECKILADRDWECTNVVQYERDGKSCGCWRKSQCCGECTPSDKNLDWHDKDLYTIAKNNPDPTCAAGTKSEDGKYCCPAGCSKCMNEPLVQVNFSPSALRPEGFISDAGEVFKAHENGFSYGWNCDVTKDAWDQWDQDDAANIYTNGIQPGRNGCEAEQGPLWDLELTNGDYYVEILYSNEDGGSRIRGCKLEGEEAYITHGDGSTWDDVPRSTPVWFKKTVTVADGKLTFAGDKYRDCRVISAMRVYKSTAAVTGGCSGEDMCCPAELAMASRPCSANAPPCTLA